jgi:hypothetical protein
MFYDTFFMDFVNSSARVVVSFIMVHHLLVFYDAYKFQQRLGMALIGSGSLFTIPPIWSIRPDTDVFDGWSTFMITLGIIVFFVGMENRFIRHGIGQILQIRINDMYQRKRKS